MATQEERIAALEQQREKDQKLMKDIAHHVTMAEGMLLAMQPDLSTTKKAAARIDRTVMLLDRGLSRVETVLSEQGEDLFNFKQAVLTRFDAQAARIEDFIQEVRARFDKQEARFDAQDARFDKLDTKIDLLLQLINPSA